MKKFIVIYHASNDAAKKMGSSTPEEMKKGMEPWMAWAKRCGSGLVDMGMPLGSGRKVMKDGVAAGDATVVGYSMLQAEDMDGAVAMLTGHPHIEWAEGCTIEVHEARAALVVMDELARVLF